MRALSLSLVSINIILFCIYVYSFTIKCGIEVSSNMFVMKEFSFEVLCFEPQGLPPVWGVAGPLYWGRALNWA